MRRTLACILFVVVLSTIPLPAVLHAADPKEARPNGLEITGSVFLTILNIPWKSISCASTVAITGLAYVFTAGVPGNYEGETHGENVGDVARSVCSGPWVIRPSRVQEDYREEDGYDSE